MTQLKYPDMPIMEEGEAINLIMKHFPISIKAYIQNYTKKKIHSNMGETRRNWKPRKDRE